MKYFAAVLATYCLLCFAAEPSLAGRKEALEAHERGDYATALRELLTLAEQGDTIVFEMLGDMYRQGQGTARNPTEAAKWYRKAVENAEPMAAFKLATSYNLGEGVPKDPKKAFELYKLASELGDAEATYIVGYALYVVSSDMTPQDRVESARWFARAAAVGHGLAKFWLANLFWFGKYAEKDQDLALELYREASAQGVGEAMIFLAAIHLTGEGGRARDLREAAKWSILASKYITLTEWLDNANQVYEATKRKALPREWSAGERMAQLYTPAPVKPQRRKDPSAPLEPAGSGTGFFVSADGHILTNAHVIPSCREVRVSQPAKGAVRVAVAARDAQNDLALLKSASKPAVVAVFRNGRGIRAGDNVLAVGFPLPGVLSSDTKVTSGSINSLSGARDDTRFLQFSAPIQGGNSGGPLIDLSGNVVGVVTAALDALAIAERTGTLAQNVNYALKLSVARNFLDTHNIPYRTKASERELSPGDAAAIARDFTVQVTCYR